MARHLLTITIALALGFAASGCLRQNFDLCDEDPPHPDCARIDAGPDAGLDGGAADGGAADGGDDAGP